MFFILSKVIWAILSPLNLIAVLVMAGLILLRTRCAVWGRRILGLAAALFLICGLFPVGGNLLVWLERPYTISDPMPEAVDGIIVLGGGVDAGRSALYGQLSVGDYGERLTEALRLAKLYPKAKLVYTGGDGGLGEASSKESTEVRNYLKQIDFMTERFVFEDLARNTYENMLFSRELVKPKSGERWLLVTSAFHMKRSAAIFAAGGWEVVPYPAGYLERNTYYVMRDFDVLGNFYKLQVAMKEIVGIIAYSLTGKL